MFMKRETAEGSVLGRIIALALSVCLCVSCSDGALAAGPFDADRVAKVAAMLGAEPGGFGRPCKDREAWQDLAKDGSFSRIIGRAEELLQEAIPDQTDDLYLDFSRTGNRRRWESVSGHRRGMVSTLALAECLDDKGRFVSALEQVVREICAERTWVMPAHDTSLTNFDGKIVDIDLGSSMFAWSLATARYLLADKLSPEVDELVRANLERRIFKPYRDMVNGAREKNWWMTTTNNWNAVCLGGVTGSALATLESRDERAFYILAAEDYLKNFLEGFTDDGYCSEGLGYWNYGFGYYVLLSEAIHQATNGGVDLLAIPKVKHIAAFGSNIEIQDDVYPAFADCSIDTRPASHLMYFINRRCRLGLAHWDEINPVSSSGSVYSSLMYSFPNSASSMGAVEATSSGPGIRTYFKDAGILICRPAADSGCKLAVALKGGHNAEHHNHNDVGSFIVVLEDNPLLLDPGAEVYTRRTFSSRRYDSNVLNSFGHPVPVVAGKLQKTGGGACGRILETGFTDSTDTIIMDISSAYDVPQLEKLQRTFIYSRDEASNMRAGCLTVEDEVVFSKPSQFGVALITFHKWSNIRDISLLVHNGGPGLRIEIDAGDLPFEIEAETIDEDVRAASKPTRIGINLSRPVLGARICVRITPVWTQPYSADS